MNKSFKEVKWGNYGSSMNTKSTVYLFKFVFPLCEENKNSGFSVSLFFYLVSINLCNLLGRRQTKWFLLVLYAAQLPNRSPAIHPRDLSAYLLVQPCNTILNSKHYRHTKGQFSGYPLVNKPWSSLSETNVSTLIPVWEWDKTKDRELFLELTKFVLKKRCYYSI